MSLPSIAELARSGAQLTALQAVAGKLWLGYGGDAHDEDGAVARVIAAYWAARPGANSYWDYLSTRMACAACGETYKLENLAVCPNCFRTYCPREPRACPCGFQTLG